VTGGEGGVSKLKHREKKENEDCRVHAVPPVLTPPSYPPSLPPSFDQALDCEAFAVSRRVLRQGESSYSCNEVFSSMFMKMSEAERTFERATGIDAWLR